MIQTKSKKATIIEKFLSQLSDQFNKNFYWRESQQKLYEMKFAQIPDAFLIESFKNFLIEKLGRDLPTVPYVYEFVKNQRGFEKHWEYYYRGGEYCVHCRTDKDGYTGGYRNVFIWGYKPDGQLSSRLHVAKCNCEAGITHQGATYEELIDAMAAKHPEAQITVSFWDGTRIIDSKSQSSFAWEKRVVAGTVARGADGYEIIWDHPFWRSSIGIRILQCNDIEVPEEWIAEAEYNTASYTAARGIKRKTDNKRKIAADGYKGPTMRSIGAIL